MTEDSGILILEDERLVAENLVSILESAGYGPCHISDHADEALQLFRQNNIDLIISDINLYGKTEGPAIVRKLLEHKEVPVIYLSAYTGEHVLQEALYTKPAAYVVKPFIDRQLLVAVKMALNIREAATTTSEFPRPSSRELEVLQCLCEGLSSRKIAEKLFISEHTVNTHRKNVLRRYELKSTSELVAFAIKQKWIQP